MTAVVEASTEIAQPGRQPAGFASGHAGFAIGGRLMNSLLVCPGTWVPRSGRRCS